MKTQMNTSNMKKMTTTCLAFLLITFSTYAAKPLSEMNNAMAGIETLMNLTMESIRYTAPATTGQECVYAETERIEELANLVEASLKYKAATFEEAAEVADAIERIEMLTAATSESLRYQAPAVDANEAVEPAMERIDMLTASLESSLKYKAPESNDFTGAAFGTESETALNLAEQTR
ncbi:MAG: hypothetical protein R6X09_05195 [Bacteroidales bacterium]